MPTIEFTRQLPVSAEAAFAWHARPGAFGRLTPPWEPVELIEHVGGIRDGARAVIRLHAGPFHLDWVAVHDHYIEGRQFRDVQARGPFRRWEHTHRIDPLGPDTCTLTDHIEYEPPLGALGQALGGSRMTRKITRMFGYRHAVTAADLRDHRRTQGRPPMHVAVTGGNGLIGSSLVPFLTTGGHRVTQLLRTGQSPQPGAGASTWDSEAGVIDSDAFKDADAVIHLAGVNVAARRWSRRFKELLIRSRVDSTRLLAETVAKLPRRPSVLICASATGIYGNRGEEVLSESSPAGEGFFAELCRQWEAAARPAVEAGVRVVWARLGIILTPRGGALRKLLTPTRCFLGGPIGGGEQFWNWASIDDAVGAIHHAVVTPSLRGPVNIVAPEQVRNAGFAAAVARAVDRPSWLAAPAPMVRLALGGMADEALLASTRAVPAALAESGYVFRHARLDAALSHLLRGGA